MLIWIITFILGILAGIGLIAFLANHIFIVESHRNLYDNIGDYGKDDDYTTLNQSKALIEMGLLEKAELLNPSAYYIYYDWVYNTTPVHAHTTTPVISFENIGDDSVPCWSTERLISLLSSISDKVVIKKKRNYYSAWLRIGKKFYIAESSINLSDLLFNIVYHLLKENDIWKEEF